MLSIYYWRRKGKEFTMHSIKKYSEPQELKKFNNEPHSNWCEIHIEKNKHVYEACVSQLKQDQMNLCGYTELCLDPRTYHIDHYIKRSIEPKLTFEWTNMILAVKDSRFGADYKDKMVTRINYDKGTEQYSNIYNPLLDDLTGKFHFNTDGYMYPADSNDSKAQNTIDVFCLNERSLKASRRDCMTYVRKMRLGGMSDNEIRETLRSDGLITAVEYELSQMVDE